MEKSDVVLGINLRGSSPESLVPLPAHWGIR
jgi:hypothetical protein